MPYLQLIILLRTTITTLQGPNNDAMVAANSFDVLIIGSGAAGLSLALRLPASTRIAILAKSRLEEGSTLYAQGGISAVMDPSDSFESHIADTLDAGAGLNKPETVRFTIEHAPEAIRWLVDLGVPFTRHYDSSDPDGFHLTREGGHSTRRVMHAADATGRAMETTLLAETRKRDNIQLFEHHIAIDLITGAKLGLTDNRCLGAYVLDRKAQQVNVFAARKVAPDLVSEQWARVWLLGAALSVLLAVAVALVRRLPPHAGALALDRYHRLRGRLTTALELSW